MEKFHPDSRRRYFAEPTDWKPESAVASLLAHLSADGMNHWTWKRMYMRSPFLPDPGMDARMPIVSGLLAVSQTLIVAHRSLDLSPVGAPAADATGTAASSASGKAAAM